MRCTQYRDIPEIIADRYGEVLFDRIQERGNGEVFFVRIAGPSSTDFCGPPIDTEAPARASAQLHEIRFVVRVVVEGWARRYTVEPHTPDDRELLAGIALELERDERDWAPIVEEFRRWGSDKT